MDTGLEPEKLNERIHGSLAGYLNPFGNPSDVDHTGIETRLVSSRDGPCVEGAEVFLKRLFYKLFEQVRDLQPSELDEEFTYQTTISYEDYLEMLKHDKHAPASCATLIDMENILSKIMSIAVVKRPMHTNIFTNLISPFLSATSYYDGRGLSITLSQLHAHLLIVLLVVGLLSWFLSSTLKVRKIVSIPTSILVVGFVEFCMHKNELDVKHRLNLERCHRPSLLGRIFSLFNYDYDNCANHASHSKVNIAFTGMEYLSELFSQPFISVGDKIGKGMSSYLNAFTGWNYLIAPIFPLIAIISFFFITLPMLYYVYMRCSSPPTRPERSKYKAIKSPKKSKTNHQNNHRAIR